MSKVLFDTSILVDYLRGDKKAGKILESIAKREIKGILSVITEAELYAGKDCNTEKGLNSVRDLISLFEKIILDNEIAKSAGWLRRRYNIAIPDAIIAATAFKENAKVWTKNIDDFQHIIDVKAEEPY